jgi:MFS family permease
VGSRTPRSRREEYEEETGSSLLALRRHLHHELSRQVRITLHSSISFNINHLDRNNIAAAKLKGLTEDLGIEGDEAKYQTCLSILYVGYILMQVPSNMFINTISRPSLYISIIMLLWGMVSTLSGVTHNFAGMVATRFFLGFVEAAFLPGALMVSLNTFHFSLFQY